jgi:hypothetical protein
MIYYHKKKKITTELSAKHDLNEKNYIIELLNRKTHRQKLYIFI